VNRQDDEQLATMALSSFMSDIDPSPERKRRIFSYLFISVDV